jgi:hypothetical protein
MEITFGKVGMCISSQVGTPQFRRVKFLMKCASFCVLFHLRDPSSLTLAWLEFVPIAPCFELLVCSSVLAHTPSNSLSLGAPSPHLPSRSVVQVSSIFMIYVTHFGLNIRWRIASETKTPWPQHSNELYRPSVHRLSAKLVPTFADRGCHVVSVTDSYGRIVCFLDRSRYFCYQAPPQLYSRGWVDSVPDPLLLGKSGSAGNRNMTSGYVARNSYLKVHVIFLPRRFRLLRSDVRYYTIFFPQISNLNFERLLELSVAREEGSHFAVSEGQWRSTSVVPNLWYADPWWYTADRLEVRENNTDNGGKHKKKLK